MSGWHMLEVVCVAWLVAVCGVVTVAIVHARARRRAFDRHVQRAIAVTRHPASRWGDRVPVEDRPDWPAGADW